VVSICLDSPGCSASVHPLIGGYCIVLHVLWGTCFLAPNSFAVADAAAQALVGMSKSGLDARTIEHLFRLVSRLSGSVVVLDPSHGHAVARARSGRTMHEL